MASIERYNTQKGPRWRVRWLDGPRQPSQGGFKSHRDADIFAAEVERCQRLGIPFERRTRVSPTFEEVSLAWVKDAERRGLSSNRIDAAVLTHDQFQAWKHGRRRGSMYFDAVSKPAILEWYTAMLEGYTARPVGTRRTEPYRLKLAPSTAFEKANCIYTLWRFAYDFEDYEDLVKRPPRRTGLDKPAPSLEPFAPTFAQMDAAVLSGDPGHWTTRLAILGRYTHLRKQQRMHLRGEDIDLQRLELRVRPQLPGSKSKHERSQGRWMPLHPALAEEIAGWGPLEGWLIDRRLGHHGNRPCNPDRRSVPYRYLKALWAGAHEEGHLTDRELADLRQPFHCFRKGLYTSLISMGVDSFLLDYLQGRAPKSVGLDTYTHWRRLEPVLREVMDVTPAVQSNVVSLRQREQA